MAVRFEPAQRAKLRANIAAKVSSFYFMSSSLRINAPPSLDDITHAAFRRGPKTILTLEMRRGNHFDADWMPKPDLATPSRELSAATPPQERAPPERDVLQIDEFYKSGKSPRSQLVRIVRAIRSCPLGGEMEGRGTPEGM